jgi:hypothetical protein
VEVGDRKIKLAPHFHAAVSGFVSLFLAKRTSFARRIEAGRGEYARCENEENSMRKKVNIYLTEETIFHHQIQAQRDGISLSAQLVRTLRWHEQIDELQAWLTNQFDRLEARLGEAQPDAARAAVNRMLWEFITVDHLPVETLVAILRDLKEEIDGMTEKQREHYAAKGRELLAKMNGGSK